LSRNIAKMRGWDLNPRSPDYEPGVHSQTAPPRVGGGADLSQTEIEKIGSPYVVARRVGGQTGEPDATPGGSWNRCERGVFLIQRFSEVAPTLRHERMPSRI
jgi:hypothetical protein